MKYLKISEFAHLTGIPRQNLIFYDKENILKPAFIDSKNNYRYYTLEQVDLASAIIVLRESGFSLEQIKNWNIHRTPKTMQNVFHQEAQEINSKIKYLQQLQDVLMYRQKNIQEANELPTLPYIKTNIFPKTPIILSKNIPDNDNYWLAFQNFINYCKENHITTSIPISSIISKNNAETHNYQNISNFFYRPINPTLFLTNSFIPKEQYLQVYHYANYEDTSEIYTFLYHYLHQHHLLIDSNIYQEYLIDEASSSSPKNYILKLTLKAK